MASEVDRVCPGCGRRSSTSPLAVIRPTCPEDGRVLVTERALERSHGDPFLGATLDGEFVPLELAAVGTHAAIYRGVGPANEAVALKIARLDGPMDEAQVRGAWRREVRALAGLPSSAFAAILGSGQTERPPAVFVALEWVEGTSLRTLLADGPIALDVGLRIGIEVCDALEALHARGLVHADLKPANAILDEGGRLRLVDLGSATAEGERAPTVTPHYASPEQIRGEPIDRRADFYALGAVLYHVLTGRPPFQGNGEAVFRAHQEVAAPSPTTSNPALPWELDGIVLGLLEKRSGDRPGSAAAVGERLAKLLSSCG